MRETLAATCPPPRTPKLLVTGSTGGNCSWHQNMAKHRWTPHCNIHDTLVQPRELKGRYNGWML
jgi:hypothetical protein